MQNIIQMLYRQVTELWTIYNSSCDVGTFSEDLSKYLLVGDPQPVFYIGVRTGWKINECDWDWYQETDSDDIVAEDV